ncbi:MAG: hypothetical protein RMA76_45055 [Deltaproteobacteria bacterium]|jgi:hypothetical protein
MRRILVGLLGLPALLMTSPAWAEDDVPDLVDAMGVEETRFEVVPRDAADGRTQAPIEADDPVTIPLVRDIAHRDEGRVYLDPFLGREIYPELSARVFTAFGRKRFANGGEPGGGDGTMALVGRADVSLWFLDLRLPVDSSAREDSGPFELVLKAPFGIGHHRFAPLLVVHVADRLATSVVEAGIGYHYARQGLALKLEVTAFDGAPDRTRVGAIGGKLGWNAQVSYLLTDHVGFVVEADGVTAISEREGQPPPAVGDTIVRLLPGVRFFLPEADGVELGVAGLLTFVPDGYGVARTEGLLLDFAYTFF